MKDLISKVSTAFLLLFATTLTFMYSEGWRFELGNNNTDSQLSDSVIKTGMLAVRSIPEGAKVYIDNEANTATDDTISSLKPGTYNLKIVKDGFEPWNKQIEVYPELVTDITAVLILQSPKLEPLTNTDVKTFVLGNNQNNITYITQNNIEQPGIWVLPLNQNGINFFRNESYPLIVDTPSFRPSLGEELKWSPDDKQLLVKMNQSGYVIYKNISEITNPKNAIPSQVADQAELEIEWMEYWKENFLENKKQTLAKQNIPELITDEIENTYGTWSPDDEKFYIIKKDENNLTSSLIVYNSEKPLPVGERNNYLTIANFDAENTKVTWYSDSYHLILVEKVPERPDYYVISMIRIDGTNKTPIYTGNLASEQAYPTPSGDRILVLTSLKEGAPANIYSIAIR